jgi:hypothetical protein
VLHSVPPAVAVARLVGHGAVLTDFLVYNHSQPAARGGPLRRALRWRQRRLRIHPPNDERARLVRLHDSLAPDG